MLDLAEMDLQPAILPQQLFISGQKIELTFFEHQVMLYYSGSSPCEGCRSGAAVLGIAELTRQ